MNPSPSPTTVSDMLTDLYHFQEDIENTLLIGEKISMIEEVSKLYNHLKSLITPEYLQEEETEWLHATTDSWNDDIRAYSESHTSTGSFPIENSAQKFVDMLNDMIDDIMDGFEPPQDNGGFGGGDGIH